MEFALRPWQLVDIDNLVKYANNPKIANNMTNNFPYPYTAEDGVGFIVKTMLNEPTTIFAIDIGGEAVGGIGLHPQKDIQIRNTELGYWLGEPFWGHGIMTEAIKRMVDYGFEHFDVTRIFAKPFGRNIGSQKALTKAGLVLEARFSKTFFKNEEFEDELIYGIRRETWKK